MSPRILVWDIENSPAEGYFWGSTYQTNIIKVKRSSSVMSFAAKWLHEKEVLFHSDHHDGHEGMLQAGWDLLDQADALVSYNGKGHDTPHMLTEFFKARRSQPSPVVEIDLYKTMKKLKFQQNKLDFIVQQMGLGKKVTHEGFPLWLACMEGNEAAWKRFRRYNIRDVTLTEKLHDLALSWVPGAQYPNLNLFTDGPEGCPRCGSGKLEKRGFKAAGLGTYQQFLCQACGHWSRSGKALKRVDLRSSQ